MKTEQEIKNLLVALSNSGSKSRAEEKILFAKINILHWVLQSSKEDALIAALNK